MFIIYMFMNFYPIYMDGEVITWQQILNFIHIEGKKNSLERLSVWLCNWTGDCVCFTTLCIYIGNIGHSSFSLQIKLNSFRRHFNVSIQEKCLSVLDWSKSDSSVYKINLLLHVFIIHIPLPLCIIKIVHPTPKKLFLPVKTVLNIHQKCIL